MLKLTSITKNYLSGDNTVEALKGVSIEFRKNEFVSILGPSGCGKTTLLNIIGGLDRYTAGDLQINGKSTKQFTNRDWDTYRNHSIGFVFQNYNLIPHQTVLSNVELALTLSGVSKQERKKKAKEVLEKVGLKDQINKKPNQMSGGQMQRVAIARALVNDPEILLADEPTGALDTVTSKQIMDILKEIAKEKLVIMVTHNSEIAENYSTRIVKLLDGKIIDDTNPYKSEKEEQGETEKYKSKTHMSFITALSLSLNNLMTKKGRTFLTAFAGSIGIIGIALIMSLSNGVQKYIDKVQEDTLSSYPLTIAETTMDTATMMETLMSESEKSEDFEEGKIYSENIMTDMISLFSQEVETNNLEELKKYLDSEKTEIAQYANAVQYSYKLPLNIYRQKEDSSYIQVNPSAVMKALGMENATNSSTMMYASTTDVWAEMLDNQELLESQYDVLAGKWPQEYNEVVLIIGKNNEISDYTLYSLGLKDMDELMKKYQTMIKGEEIEKDAQTVYTYNDFLDLSFKLLLNTDYYEKENGIWVNKSTNEDYMNTKLENGTEIKIVGIIRPNEEAVATAMQGGIIGYTTDLTKYVIETINGTEIAQEQSANENVNILTGLEFSDELNTRSTFSYTSLSDEQKTYLASLSEEERVNVLATYAQSNNATYEDVLETLGVVSIEKPSAINIYPKDFESKDEITRIIEKYNTDKRDQGKEEDVITYTDVVGILMNSITTIVNVISYILIAFVAISLVVSSIMIGIITYISVLERIKEIGILRSIGASKKDISRVFRAETFIVGISAGLIGIGITLLLIIPINIIIKNLANISNAAVLPTTGAAILVIISILLTVVAGLIPSKIAAKKDPVEALRTE